MHPSRNFASREVHAHENCMHKNWDSDSIEHLLSLSLSLCFLFYLLANLFAIPFAMQLSCAKIRCTSYLLVSQQFGKMQWQIHKFSANEQDIRNYIFSFRCRILCRCVFRFHLEWKVFFFLFCCYSFRRLFFCAHFYLEACCSFKRQDLTLNWTSDKDKIVRFICYRCFVDFFTLLLL